MSEFQKVIKVVAICLGVFIIVNIVGVVLAGISIATKINYFTNNEEIQTFAQSYQGVERIEIDSVISSINIKQGDEYRVEATNLKNKFSATLQNGTLKIEENRFLFFGKKRNEAITIYIPKENNLNKLNIDAGAGRIEISDISVNNFDIDQGAGIIEITNSKFNRTSIDGGAGEIKISACTLNDMDLNAGIGKITLQGAVTGNSKIECGIGEMNILLDGEEADYNIRANKGIGNITINNNMQEADTVYGTGKNKIILDGGIGNITVDFSRNSK